MSHVTVGGRVYVTDLDDFAYKQRTMLKIADSALILADTGLKKGYIGKLAKADLVDPVTKLNAKEEVFDLPLDWRLAGRAVLDQYNVSIETQTIMFDKFIANYTVEQRRVFINMYASIDPADTEALAAFVQNMLAMLVA
jgi:hypothetical protein